MHNAAVLRGPGATVYLMLGLQTAAKASPDDPKHPGWPAGTPGGLGGKFRPKDGAATSVAEAAIDRIALRRSIRVLLIDALTLPAEAAANMVPVLGEAADIALVGRLAETYSEFRQLDIDTRAALDFIADGPHDLDDLRVSQESESFSSYREFYKTDLLEVLLAKRYGPAGDGYEYHHIVEQGGSNGTRLPSEALQSTDNIVRIPTILHQAINAAYSGAAPDATGISERGQLRTQGYEAQREEGIRIMRKLGIIR